MFNKDVSLESDIDTYALTEIAMSWYFRSDYFYIVMILEGWWGPIILSSLLHCNQLNGHDISLTIINPTLN